jgi:Domain of unknown function (DUF4349)
MCSYSSKTSLVVVEVDHAGVREVAMRAMLTGWTQRVGVAAGADGGAGPVGRVLALLAVSALLVAGCGGGGAGDTAGGAQVASSSGDAPAQAPDFQPNAQKEALGGGTESGAGRDGAGAGAGAPASAGGQGNSAVQLVDLDNRIIRNASVQLEIGQGKLDQTIRQASQVVARHQGIFAGSKTSAPDGGTAQGVVTFRVPNPQFEQTINELKALGTYRGESSDSTDVTSQYVDTKSQLNAWRAQEGVYLRLLGQSKTVSDTLSVRARLDEVQSTINRLQGQLNVLEDQTSLATINLELREPGAAPSGPPTNPIAQAWQTGVNGFLFMVKAVIIGVMWLTPVALVALLVLFVLRMLRPYRQAPRPAPSAPSADA